jgi:acetolactate synthase-1/2/3 large subunit
VSGRAATVGTAIAARLRAHGVEVVFGIPGVHTIELYRGLAAAGLRHVTARHEQGAGFMADGYARVAGRPGVALVISGPGLTNTLTAMAQARAEGVPILVLSGETASETHGRGLGYLHELPDQPGLSGQVALASIRVSRPEDADAAIDSAFARMRAGRGGPVHVQVPLDVTGLPAVPGGPLASPVHTDGPEPTEIAAAIDRLRRARRPVILAGGGARGAAGALAALAERLDAPVVQTVNARGLMHRHPLAVPASPSLDAVRRLIGGSDAVLAVGTELGPTDYDMYGRGGFPSIAHMVRIDRDPAQLARHAAAVTMCGDAGTALEALQKRLAPRAADGTGRAAAARLAAHVEIGPAMQHALGVVEAIRDTLPGAIMVGDSTHPVYAANLFYDHDRPGGWFNAATGYGTLGFAPGAAIGAAIANPGAPVVCLVGDGGLQFTLGELGTAVEAGTGVLFLLWNNAGYGEIASAMTEAGMTPIGVDLLTPDFRKIAAAYGLAYVRPESLPALRAAVRRLRRRGGPALIEWREARR